MLQGYGWDYSDIYGYFGAAAVCSKILRLEESKILNAMGIAYLQSSGTMCQIFQGYDTKAMGSGFAAMGGVISALMAQKGMTGSNEPIDGKWGIYDLYMRGKYNSKYLIGELGKYFMVEDDSIKPYPCCRSCHASIDATRALVKEDNIKPWDVESVNTYVGPYTFKISKPVQIKQNPPNSVAAQFSIPWSLANVIIHHKLELDHFAENNLRNQDVLKLAHRVIVKLDPQLSKVGEREPAVVEIKTKEGIVYSKRIDYTLGSPKNPLSKEELIEKFRSCAGFTAKPVSKENLLQVIQMINSLENITDVCQIIRLL